jgi:hypothetical protein
VYLLTPLLLLLLLIYPERYIVSDKEGYDPAAEGKVWTTPAQDPALTGDMSRPAWLLTRETPGADLLAGELNTHVEESQASGVGTKVVHVAGVCACVALPPGRCHPGSWLEVSFAIVMRSDQPCSCLQLSRLIWSYRRQGFALLLMCWMMVVDEQVCPALFVAAGVAGALAAASVALRSSDRQWADYVLSHARYL